MFITTPSSYTMISALLKSIVSVFRRTRYSYELSQWKRMLYTPYQLTEVVVIGDPVLPKQEYS